MAYVIFDFVLMLHVFRSNHHCSDWKFHKFHRKTPVLGSLFFLEMMKLLKDICSAWVKVDVHSANVSYANDAICWGFFFQSTFEANKMFCLLGKFVIFMKQPLKYVQQNSYQDFWSYTLYIIWQGVHPLVK